MIIAAGNSETFDFAHSIGVGLIDSAINLTQLCLFDKPDYLIFIGSAGSYGNYNLFDVIESTSASNIETSFLQNDSYTPIDNVVALEEKLNIKNQTIVNSSNYISTNEKITKNFNQYNIGIENMEFFSVMKIAQKFEINVAGIFVITNFTNKNAHSDFIKNHDKAKDILINYIKNKGLIIN
jgi:nucleoside phosphorylase